MPTNAEGWYRVLGWLFARNAVCESVATRVHLDATPDEIWNHIMLYEEVPGHPPFLLRALLPNPVRTQGNKNRIGSTVRCTYTGGVLVKRITTVDPPHSLQFEVIEQQLGIERCMFTLGGSYQIYTCNDAADVVLITKYQAYLRPRCLWRHLEELLVSQLHSHILRGVAAAVLPREPAIRPAVAEPLASQCAPTGDLSCIAQSSLSRR